jgi:hypothetical protein
MASHITDVMSVNRVNGIYQVIRFVQAVTLLLVAR